MNVIRVRQADVDCNYCNNLNMSETQQQTIRNGNSLPHICQYYNSRVFHQTFRKRHNPKLFPCIQCREHDYKQFSDRR